MSSKDLDIETLSIDQLQVFMAAAEHGSFSAAARALGRTQSLISYAVQRLEEQVGLVLFDRAGYRPRLTEAGQALLPRARRIVGEVSAFHALSRGLSAGVEAEVCITVDAMYPMCLLLRALLDFRDRWPAVSPRVLVGNMGAAVEQVLDGHSLLGLVNPVATQAPELELRPAAFITMVPVAAPHHPLARHEGELLTEDLRDHVQLVLTDRATRLSQPDRGVFSSQTWRLNDLGAKHSMLLAGLGWGGMPEHMVRDDLTAGRLVQLPSPYWDPHRTLPMSVAYRRDARLGPAAQWLATHLSSLVDEAVPTPGAQRVQKHAAA
ncbi:LysR family transcriptional regulator [Pseudoxanthomonas sp. JBR18]|uniref:LysR family transcriptional regulator n=1 Tax=Pseudoxanthomonas sp. JBR18 TaxID=2969308 RepID=UPI002306A082|nr:LysR family transcriptional regulator [Pseudoxanthomonas sp. JBR18]WCE06035.1 LysR family transcriptional regulator [Pseudoxanthomonas sp. JBR18]